MTDSKQLIERLRTIAAKQIAGDISRGAIFPSTLEESAAALEARDAKITDLEARLRLAEKRADDAEARNDFLIGEIDKLREKARQS